MTGPPPASPEPLPAGVAQVVVGLPVPRVFSYAVGPALAGRLAPGQRVRVPFRRGHRTGVVVAVEAGEPAGLAVVDTALDPVPALTPPLLALTRWSAAETVSAWGEAVIRALPPGSGRGAPDALPPPPAPAPGGRPVVAWGPGRAALVEAAAARALGSGGAALVLVPDIERARGWAARLTDRLGERVALATSEESPRRRWAAWWDCRRGATRVAVGTRVAAFLPLAPLGLAVVVDEEDPVHKAPDAPRWHARDLALHRLELEGGAGLLLSAAPSLESWVRVRSGAARAEVVPGEAWPVVRRVDLRAAGGDDPLTPPLRDAVRAALGGGGVVLLLLNRLGYGRSLGCAECGAIRRCRTCRTPLTFHREVPGLECRVCGLREPARSLCGVCRGRRLQPEGWGTERVEAAARRAFPGAGVVRYDGSLEPARAEAARRAVRRGEVRLVVGTQMALRLLGEAPVSLAALLHADAALQLPDFRAAERVVQLAWRLAEGIAPGGCLWLQAFHPAHAALQAVADGSWEAFYEAEWTERRELGYPPAGRMVRLVCEGREAAAAADDLAGRCRTAGLTVLGPAPAPGPRRQLVVLGDAALPGALAEVLAPLRGHRRIGTVRLAVDVDPVE